MLAQLAPTDPSLWYNQGGFVGLIIVGAALAIGWLMMVHNKQINKITDDGVQANKTNADAFANVIKEKDTALLNMTGKFESTIRDVSTNSEKSVREQREEYRRIVDQQFGISKDLVAGYEQVSMGQIKVEQAANEAKIAAYEAKNAANETRAAVAQLAARMDAALERSHTARPTKQQNQ